MKQLNLRLSEELLDQLEQCSYHTRQNKTKLMKEGLMYVLKKYEKVRREIK